jgi:superfamily I DNA/RNA helicase
LPIDVENMKLKDSTSFMEEVRGFNQKYKKKSELELKEFSAEEDLRLFYVAITRAKKKLYITTSRKVKTFSGGEKEEQPCIIFESLI